MNILTTRADSDAAFWDHTGILALDGRCGSGKTTWAKHLAGQGTIVVVSMDDFYLPADQRRSGPAGHMDIARIRTMLQTLSNEKDAAYAPFDCRNQTYKPSVRIPWGKRILVEGSYAMHPDLQAFYDFMFFMTCGKDVQKQRLLRRDPERFPDFEQRWIPREEAYFQAYATASKANALIVTNDWKEEKE